MNFYIRYLYLNYISFNWEKTWVVRASNLKELRNTKKSYSFWYLIQKVLKTDFFWQYCVLFSTTACVHNLIVVGYTVFSKIWTIFGIWVILQILSGNFSLNLFVMFYYQNNYFHMWDFRFSLKYEILRILWFSLFLKFNNVFFNKKRYNLWKLTSIIFGFQIICKFYNKNYQKNEQIGIFLSICDDFCSLILHFYEVI